MNQILTDLPLTTYAVLPDDGKIDGAALVLHGYGSDGRDMAGLADVLKNILPHVAFYCPNAPEALSFGGFEWFAFDDYDQSRIFDEQWGLAFLNKLTPRIEKIMPVMHAYLAAVMKHAGVSADKTALTGFSQGGGTALMTALTYPEQTACAVGMSAVPLMTQGGFSSDKIKSKPPVTLVHGDADNVLPLRAFEIGRANLQAAGVAVDGFVVPDLMHGIDQTALSIMANALFKALK